VAVAEIHLRFPPIPILMKPRSQVTEIPLQLHVSRQFIYGSHQCVTAEACARARGVRACLLRGVLSPQTTKVWDVLTGRCLHTLHGHRGAAAVGSFWAAVLAEIYLCGICSCQEILRRNGRGQVRSPRAASTTRGSCASPVSSALCWWRSGGGRGGGGWRWNEEPYNTHTLSRRPRKQWEAWRQRAALCGAS
jgi:hypothetical protein